MNESNESMRVSRGLLLRQAVACPVASAAIQPSTHWSKPRQLRLPVLSVCVPNEADEDDAGRGQAWRVWWAAPLRLLWLCCLCLGPMGG